MQLNNKKGKNKWLLVYVGIISCLFIVSIAIFNNHRNKLRENYKYVNKETELNIEVLHHLSYRGSIIINKEIIIPPGITFLGEIPEWVTEKHPPLYRPPESIFSPYLDDIDPPYKLIKESGANLFKVIKHNDTLTFEMLDPELENTDHLTIKE